MKTQEEFFQAHAVDGQLSDEHMAQMLNLPQGDSGAMPQSSEPAAAASANTASDGEPQAKKDPEPEPAKKEPDAGADPNLIPEGKTPVITAKDGVHTIAYEKLVQARDEAKAAREEAKAAKDRTATLEAENAALKTAPPAQAPAAAKDPATGTEDVHPIFGDFSEEALAKGIEQLVSAAVAPLQKQLKSTEEEAGLRSHWTAIYTAHKDFDSMLESQQFDTWKKAQPSYAQPGIQAVLEQGTAEQVVGLFNDFKAATGKTAADPAKGGETNPPKDPAAAAQAAIARAQTPPPSSLSEIPGSTGPADEASAMLEMSPVAAMSKFEGKTPAQIAALLSKVL